MTKIKIELTMKEAQELIFVAENGYGDGDFYGLNGQQGFSPKGDAKFYHRAVEKVRQSMAKIKK